MLNFIMDELYYGVTKGDKKHVYSHFQERKVERRLVSVLEKDFWVLFSLCFFVFLICYIRKYFFILSFCYL